MTVEQTLLDRSGSKCELCTSTNNLAVYNVPPNSDESADKSILLCDTCLGQIEEPKTADANHWRCLNDSMWTPVPAVQVMAWRQLNALKSEGWAQDLLEMLYLEEDVKAWAESGMADEDDDSEEATVDSNGATLNEGDTVTLIKDLVVKGANFTAKRGTVVKNISLTSNPKHIEGRVNGTRIVLVSAFLKKA
jgi:protein PhnA